MMTTGRSFQAMVLALAALNVLLLAGCSLGAANGDSGPPTGEAPAQEPGGGEPTGQAGGDTQEPAAGQPGEPTGSPGAPRHPAGSETTGERGTSTPQPPAQPTGHPASPTPPGEVQQVFPLTQPPDVHPPATGEMPAELLRAILADLAARTGADPAAIEVIRAGAVVWNDGSLGCPEPGLFYTMALVPGYQVILQVQGQQYDYRVGDAGYFKLCGGGEGGQIVTPPPGGISVDK